MRTSKIVEKSEFGLRLKMDVKTLNEETEEGTEPNGFFFFFKKNVFSNSLGRNINIL